MWSWNMTSQKLSIIAMALCLQLSLFDLYNHDNFITQAVEIHDSINVEIII